jgi:hypothetical protein
MNDVIIAGGSIAGSATANLLLRGDPGLRVLVVEKSESFGRRVGEEPAESVDDVLHTMAAIDAALPADDGVSYFNRLYLKTTEEVQSAVAGTTFEVANFLNRLDVVFANIYFDAVAQSVRGNDVAAAWAPLFDLRARTDVFPIQFALAGMNAHINHDLPIAVVTTCRELSLQPVDDSPAHRAGPEPARQSGAEGQ